MASDTSNWTPVVSVRMSPELREAAQKLAGEKNTISDVVRAALTEYAAWRGHPVV